MSADRSFPRWTCRAQLAAVAVVAALLLSLLPQTVVAAPLDRPTAHYNHIVRPGETLANIAAFYGVSVEELRAFNNLFNRGELVSCEPDADSTQVQGTVRVNGQPVSGYRVVFSWQPDGEIVARTISGEDSHPGHYTHILQTPGTRKGNWWFWIENNDGNRISEMAFVHTDREPHTGKCQRAVVDFYLHDVNLIYIGRRLHIPGDGHGTGSGGYVIGGGHITGGEPVTAGPTGGVWHEVGQGDTLSRIASRYGVTVYAIMQANDLSSVNQVLYRGTRLWIPQGGYVAPPVAPTPEPPQTTAVWTGAYYNNRHLSGAPVLTRQDAAVHFDWLTGSPDGRLFSNNFSAVWTTTSHFQADTYRFFSRSDDGVRVYVDNVLILADWAIHPATGTFRDIHLSEGNHTIRVEYFEAEGVASISVWWEKR